MVLMARNGRTAKVILCTSCVPGEGKTTTALGLALNLTGLGRKVLLIEADIRRGPMRSYFDEPPGRGLVSVLAGGVDPKEVIRPIWAVGADILFGEESKANPADLLSSGRFLFVSNFPPHQ